MPKPETLTTRVTRLENAMGQFAEGLNTLTGKLNALADAQIKTEEHAVETDERIQKLVIAIGQLISRMSPQALR